VLQSSSLSFSIRVFFRIRNDTALEILALPTTDSRAETETAAAQNELLGPTLLDCTPRSLVPMEGRPSPGETRYSGRLAPPRFPSLLALAIPATRPTRRTTEDNLGRPMESK
jgi:hypothetical protein